MTIGDKNVTAQTGFDRANWVLQVIPRSAGVLTHVSGEDPQVLSDKIGRQVILLRSGGKVTVTDEAVYIILVQPGIFDGIGRRFQMAFSSPKLTL